MSKWQTLAIVMVSSTTAVLAQAPATSPVQPAFDTVATASCAKAFGDDSLARVKAAYERKLGEAAPAKKAEWTAALAEKEKSPREAHQAGTLVQQAPAEAWTEAAKWPATADGKRISNAVCDQLMARFLAGRSPAVTLSPARREILMRISASPTNSNLFAIRTHSVSAANQFILKYDFLRAQGEDAMQGALDLIPMGAPRPEQVPKEYIAGGVDELLAPALVDLSDADLALYADWLETPAMRAVSPVVARVPMVMVSVGTSSRQTVLWQFVQAQAQAAPATPAVAGQRDPALTAQLEQAQKTLKDAASRSERAVYDALQQPSRERPGDQLLQRTFGHAATLVSLVNSKPERRLIPSDPRILTEAAEALESAVALDPKDGEAAHLLGYVRFTQTRFDDARALYDKAEALGYREPRRLVDRADVYFEEGLRDEALALTLKALAAEPWTRANVAAFYALSSAHATASNIDRIAAAFDTYLARGKSTAVERGWYADMMLRVTGDDARAAAVFAKVPPQSGFEKRLLAEALVAGVARDHVGSDGKVDAEGRATLARAAQLAPPGWLAWAMLPRDTTSSAVVVLVHEGLDVNAPQEGEPLLVWAMRYQRPVVANALLDAGADIHRAGRSGATPLHMAVSMRDPALVELLLARGADPSRKDMLGRGPLDLMQDDQGAEARKIRALLAKKAG